METQKSTPKSSPSSQKDLPPLPLRVYLQSPSPPSYNPLRDQMINQLFNISTILDSHINPSNAYIQAPPSPPLQQIHPPSHAQGTDAAMTNVQQGNENPKILQVIEDAHVTLSTVPQKTEILVTNSSHSSDLAAKFLNFLDILHTDAEIISPIDVYVHHEVPS
ncbi:hypothetical protein Tco_0781229 [Tanacetum coccineum]